MSEFDYASAPESKAIANIASNYGLFIGGKFVEPKQGKSFNTFNPATEELLSKIGYADKTDIDAAVKSARLAYTRVWSKMPAKERGKYLYRIARIMQERAREFAVVETLDNGKPIRESRDTDIPLAAAHFFYHAGWADKLEYAGFGNKPKPLGVVGQIIPWNFPLLMLAWKIAPALAAGNTVVLKPAETTPLTALLFAQVCQQAGVPEGVVNIVTGDGVTGAALVNHPDVNKIAFTGSTDVGKAIARSISATKKTATLELGGKAANLVFEDAAIDEAVEGIVNGIFFNQGHVCCAGSRLIVQENVADEILEKLKKRMSLIRVGDPMDKNTDLGAINSKEQLNKIHEISNSGDAEGANRWSPEVKLPTKGYWYPPTIFTGVSQSHRIAREEIFGPVLSVLTFRTPSEAIEKANNSMYGLSAGIWSDKGSKILWAARQLKAGVIWSNTFNKFDPASPFGGYKESGWGREGGRHGLAGYLTSEAKVSK
ncbi:MAG: aldehyde dehydrogenase family protein [Candidatus Nanopelagicus sp.]|jgi:acyl-CoA reductase-like NAD-dependent aldehyde dehydrogenase